MGIGRGNLIFLICLVCLPVAVVAQSLLTPTTFPKTIQDLSFAERVGLKRDGYLSFEELSPYEQLLIVTNDAETVQQIAEEEQQIENQTETEPGKENNTNPPVNPVQDNRPCPTKSAWIPANQTFPIGKPVDPKKHKIGSKFGWRWNRTDFHYGVDIGYGEKALGQPVFAIADGTVTVSQDAAPGKSAGNYIEITHPTGFKTRYMHLDEKLVKKNEVVKAGCQIGTIGHTGGRKKDPNPSLSEAQSHLHYEISYTGKKTSSIEVNGKTITLTYDVDKGSPKDRKNVDPEPFIMAGD